ncbi:MAG: penicillin-insensitive murein endopeptidase [Inhella sp.]
MAQGRIEGAVQLPLDGPNFRAYSTLAATLGRTHVHEQVAAVLAQSFARLQRERPELQFVYGETGKRHGGPMPPHRTHQNGLSVDLFVPVRDAQGRSVPLPTPVGLRFGYDIEFDAQGRWQDYRIDFEALAAWLRALHEAAQAQNAPLVRVILEPAYQARVIAIDPGLKELPWMKGKPWVRHDEHVHLDFGVACRPR